jgi:hypothetical protein
VHRDAGLTAPIIMTGEARVGPGLLRCKRLNCVSSGAQPAELL